MAMDKSVLNKFTEKRYHIQQKFNKYIQDNNYINYSNGNNYIALKFTEKQIGYRIFIFSILTLIVCCITFLVICFTLPEIYGKYYFKKVAVFLVLGLVFAFNIIYYIVNIIFRKFIYYKYYTLKNLRIIAISDKYKFAVFKIDEDENFIFEKEYQHLQNSFVKNVRYKTSYDIVDENNNFIENYELIEYALAYLSPYTMMFRHKILGYTYWNLNEMIEYYEKNGSPLSYVDKEYIYKNAKAF